MNKLTLLAAIACFAFAGAANAEPASLAYPASSKNNAELSKSNINQSAFDENFVDDNDPIEPVNRAIYSFNHVIDGYVIAPVARAYRYTVPQWGRQRVTNALYNITEPVTVLNSVLQADPENAFTSIWRFIINTTFGLLGTFDAASEVGLKPRSEDFGQTLGVWGYTSSTYIVLPLLGPSTLRDGVGLVADYYTNPFYNGMVTDNNAVQYGLLGTGIIDGRANLLDLTDDIEKTSLDPYATYRSGYLQHRSSEINNGKDGL